MGTGGNSFWAEGQVGLRVQRRQGQRQRSEAHLRNSGFGFAEIVSGCWAEGMDEKAGIGLV